MNVHARLARTALIGSFAIALVGFLASCQSVNVSPVASPLRKEKVQSQAGLSPQEQQWLEKNTFEGEPRLTFTPEGQNTIIVRAGYAIRHSSLYRQPIWVSEGITASELSGPGDRDKSSFAPDPKLKKAERSELSDYDRSGFDRGHMAPAGDFNRSQAATDESFFLSNMSPQIGGGFNRAVWSYLEDKARELIKKAGKGYILTGPLFLDENEENPDTADGLAEIKWVKGRLAVPTHYYKIVVTQHNDDPVECVAFVLENRKYKFSPKTDSFSQFIKSVDWIEERTGIDFMPELSPPMEKRLERNPGEL